MIGPQFNIFNKLRKIDMNEVVFDENGCPVDRNIECFTKNESNPIHISGIEELVYYKCSGKRMYFGSGSLDEYKQFLEHLSQISGFSDTNSLLNSESTCFFKELINYELSRGTIGPIIANKLYNDFRDNFNIAGTYFEQMTDGKKFWIHYQNWCAGLFVAKENGAIMVV